MVVTIQGSQSIPKHASSHKQDGCEALFTLCKAFIHRTALCWLSFPVVAGKMKEKVRVVAMDSPTQPMIATCQLSMGGTIAVRVAAKRALPTLEGLVVIDVVEGTTMASLVHIGQIDSFHFPSGEKLNRVDPQLQMSAFMQFLLCHGQQRGSFLVRGAGSQGGCVITLFKSPLLIEQSSLLVLLSHRGRSSRGIRCSSSSVGRGSSPSTLALVESGKAHTIEQVWEEYFGDPLQWWDNRVDKRNPKSPDFKHKVTRKALWVDGLSTPPWVKARLNLVGRGKLQSHGGYFSRDSQVTSHPNRVLKVNNGRRSHLPTSARWLRQTPEVGNLSMHVRSAKTTSEAIAVLKKGLQQGIAIDSYTYVVVLNWCLKQKDFVASQQVHDCIIMSGMEQDIFVANNLLTVYSRFGRLEDARRVFDELVKKDIISWNIMIGGYAQHNCGEDAMDVFRQMHQEGVQPNGITYMNILRACSSPLALKMGEEVHAYIRRGGFESDVRVGTALLKMYGKCGSIKEARKTFDNLASRNVISWNVMIGTYSGSGCGVEAYQLFLQMIREGLKPDAVTYMSILNACASTEALEWVKEVHRHILEAGLESDVRVGNALVHMYAKCGSIGDAQQVFDNMAECDVITWNVIIGAHAESGCGVEAYQLFLQMIKEGFKPDPITYVSVLNACASTGALEWVKEVHRHALEAGLESDVRVGTALVHMYAKSGSIGDARVVFDRMHYRNVITWNVMMGAYAGNRCGVEAYQLFLQMIKEGFKPDPITYVSILNASASTGALEWVKEVHRHVLEAGLESDVRVGTALVHMYAKSGNINDARLVFDRMHDCNIVTWNVMIGAYAESGCGVEAYQLFRQMIQEGFKPDPATYVSILNACANTGALEWVKEVHRHALEAGLESDVRVGTALIHMFAKSGSINDARLVFDKMQDRNVITWNVIIGAYAESGFGVDAYQLFLQMIQRGFKPDPITYVSTLNACASTGALEWVKKVHRHAVEAGLESDVRVGTVLVHAYAKNGSINDARLVFDRMHNRNIVTWNVMIGGLGQHGCGREAVEVFRKMVGDGLKPDEISFVAVLSACSHAGLVDEGRQLFQVMSQDYGMEPGVVHYTCMVDLLGRAGHLKEAKLFIDKMPMEPDGAIWGALLGSSKSYGDVELGELAAKELIILEPMQATPYVVLSNIYAAADMWQKVALVRRLMQEKGIHKEPGRSWIEVDNKVHEFIVGDTSHPEAKEIYAELKRLTEKIKAEGYLPDTRHVLHNIEEKDKEFSLCSHSEKLAIVYGLMRTTNGKRVFVRKNLRVCPDCHTATKLISKVTGVEIVVRDANRFHHMKDGVCSCKDYW